MSEPLSAAINHDEDQPPVSIQCSDGHSPPEKKTPSALTLSVLIMALCPLKLCTNVPSGHFHFLMLLPPAEPDANEYSVGWIARARTDFL